MPGGTIKNLRVRGGMLNLQEFNQDDLLCGGIFIQYDPINSSNAVISNCEIFGFSYAGIFGDTGTNAEIEYSYIHHVKGTGGKKTTAKGYGVWIQGLPSGGTTYSLNSSIFDDCKAAIDGQGNPCSWYINNCTFSQYFLQEDINKHNISGSINHDCVNSNAPCFFGSDQADCVLATSCTGQPGAFCINDVGGGDTRIINSIFHRKDNNNSVSSNISLTYPFITHNPDYEVQISNTTFSSPRQPSNYYLNNYGGYARIADNYIESCPWIGDLHLIWQNQDNFFDYSPGKQVTNSPQPPEIVGQIINQDGNTASDLYNGNGVPYYLPSNIPEVETLSGGLGSSNFLI